MSNSTVETSRSLWMENFAAPAHAPLAGSAEADVVVVGAGIAGLSTAYELARENLSVIVVDRGAVGGGMTGRTTAHLASQFDDYYYAFIRLHGVEDARVYYESQAMAIARIEAIQREESIDCDFKRVDGYLALAPGCDARLLERERDACRRIGFAGVDWADPPMMTLAGPALRFPGQARVHPLKYLAGLARAIEARGGRIHADTPIVDVEEKGAGVRVATKDGREVRARFAVVATNSPINDWIAIHTKQAPYRTYALAAHAPSNAIPDALYWDTLDPYHYARLQPREGGAWLIVGGEDHKTGEADDHAARFARLEAWMRQHFPAAGEVVHRWSGQVMEPVDSAPFIGRNHGNQRVFVATGDSGEGMTSGAVAGMLIASLIRYGEHEWAHLYRPQRASLMAARRYFSENLTAVKNYAERMGLGETTPMDAIEPGQGALVTLGGKKAAVYRDPSGRTHALSAICTHAGCVVHWNTFETCWDCPCHGSQFGVDGEPLCGPAIYPLEKL